MIKTFPTEDGGLIGPINSKPHLKKEIQRGQVVKA
jgi:hypothetical protein